MEVAVLRKEKSKVVKLSQIGSPNEGLKSIQAHHNFPSKIHYEFFVS